MPHTFRLNGSTVTVDVDGGVPLSTVLRDHLDLTGTKVACGRGECGACTVLDDGRAVAACVRPVALASDVETIESLVDESRPLRHAMAAYGAFQCGFCTPGVVVACTALLRRGQDADTASLAGNICRCTGYTPIVAALRTVADARRDAEDTP